MTKQTVATSCTSAESATSQHALPEKCNSGDALLSEVQERRLTPEQQVIVGRELLAAKAKLAGKFKRWVERECRFSYRAAVNWMAAAREADYEREITEFAERMRAQVESVSADLGFLPTRFSDERLTDAERDQLLTAGLRLALPSNIEDAFGHDGLAGLLGWASEHLPHATLGDVAEAVSRVHLMLVISSSEARNALAVLDHMPPNGIVASCAVATGEGRSA